MAFTSSACVADQFDANGERAQSGLGSSTDWTAQLAEGRARLSVVIPFYNEEGNLCRLYDRLKPVLEVIAPIHEIIFVNDGSSDKSPAEAVSLTEQDSAVTLLHFRSNFGKANALSAGFQFASGDLVLMMDADLQDQPEEAHKLINTLGRGYDLITGWKKVRHDPLHKTGPSKLFNKVVGKAFSLNIHDFNCGFKVMTAEVATELRLYGDFHRFIPVLAADLGYRVAEQPVEHAARTVGVSKYGGKRLITGFLDFMATLAVTKFFDKPTQFFGGFALKLIGLGFLTLIGLAISGRHVVPLWILAAALILGGLQIFAIGLVGELVVNGLRRSHREVEVAGPRIISQPSSTLSHAVLATPRTEVGQVFSSL